MSDHTHSIQAQLYSNGAAAHIHDYAAANQQHYDHTEAQKYDAKPQAQQLARKLGHAILTKYPSLFNEDETMVMDFACGTGLISRELSPYAKSIVGVDISQGMVDQYNFRVSNQGIPPKEMRAIRAELRGDDTELDGQKFDVVVCAAAYHHFSDVKEMTRILVSFLKPGGSLLVADIVKDENRGGPELLEHFHHVVAHKSGFSEPEMRDTFETGGLGAFEFGTVTRAKLHGDDVDFFLAKGTKVV